MLKYDENGKLYEEDIPSAFDVASNRVKKSVLRGTRLPIKFEDLSKDQQIKLSLEA